MGYLTADDGVSFKSGIGMLEDVEVKACKGDACVSVSGEPNEILEFLGKAAVGVGIGVLAGKLLSQLLR